MLGKKSVDRHQTVTLSRCWDI